MGAKIHVFDMTGQELYFIQQKLFGSFPNTIFSPGIFSVP